MQLEGIGRGLAGNTSLAVAITIDKELPREAVIVVQETEYTGAGKHPFRSPPQISGRITTETVR